MSRSSRQVKANEVYTRTKRAINELAQLAFELVDQRNPKQESRRDKEAFDALEDVQQISAELCTLWGALWKAIGEGRPDPIAWSNPAFETFDPDEADGWAERYETARAGRADADDDADAADDGQDGDEEQAPAAEDAA